MQKQSDSQKKPPHLGYKIAAVFVLCILAGYIYLVITWTPHVNLESQRANAAIIRKDIAYYINKDPNEDPNDLTQEDFAQATFLDLFIKELSDIKELSKLTNLEELALRYVKYPQQEIPKWMKTLAKYGLIDLKKKYAIDLSPLKNLSKLKKLYFETSQIRDLEPISKLENLEVLILENIAVSDLNSLKRLRNLKSLGIENCENITKKQVDDLQRALPNLEISYGE